jgi:hypothetical protein
LGFSLEAMLADGEDDEKARLQASADSWQRFRLHQHLRHCGVPI